MKMVKNEHVKKSNMDDNRKRIMIVDDEPDFREMLTLLLRKEGFEIETAEDGLDFLEKVDSFSPALVILDVMMPGLKTEEILKKLKEKKSNPKIILLTVVRFSEKEQKKLFKMPNIAAYIKKPYDLDVFLNSVKKHVCN